MCNHGNQPGGITSLLFSWPQRWPTKPGKDCCDCVTMRRLIYFQYIIIILLLIFSSSSSSLLLLLLWLLFFVGCQQWHYFEEDSLRGRWHQVQVGDNVSRTLFALLQISYMPEKAWVLFQENLTSDFLSYHQIDSQPYFKRGLLQKSDKEMVSSFRSW